MGEFGFVDSDLSNQTFDGVPGTGGDGDPRHIPFLCVAGKSGDRLIGNLIVLALVDERNGDLTTPLTDLNDQRDIGPGGGILQSKFAVYVGGGLDQGAAGELILATFAGDSIDDGSDVTVGDVHDHVGQGKGARGNGHPPGDTGRRLSGRTGHLIAGEVDARGSAVTVAAISVADFIGIDTGVVHTLQTGDAIANIVAMRTAGAPETSLSRTAYNVIAALVGAVAGSVAASVAASRDTSLLNGVPGLSTLALAGILAVDQVITASADEEQKEDSYRKEANWERRLSLEIRSAHIESAVEATAEECRIWYQRFRIFNELESVVDKCSCWAFLIQCLVLVWDVKELVGAGGFYTTRAAEAIFWKYLKF